MTATHTSAPKVPAPNVKQFTVKVKRQDKPDSTPYWDEFVVPYQPNLNVIIVLQWIAANPITTAGKEVAPVAWEAACLEEVCGSCTVNINGRARQACSTLIDVLLAEGPVVELAPLTKFPVIRDLAVDRQRMFDSLIAIKAWVPIDGTHALGQGPKESPPNQETRYALSRCMTCGCCLEACPQYTLDNSFIGAAAISQARYFNMHGTGKTLSDHRLTVLEGPGGITDCGNSQNCVKVCPKEIPLTESIASIGRQTTVHAIGKFFTGK
ncbi:MAG: succinate dehydrogenase iron-sulfur subunit [Planctomycetota bacterium]|nr:succinate dehydrogenase iron-sulfur subunit [Planctomycetota bacterium]